VVKSTYQLLSQRHLLELHAMHASIGGTEQRSCCDDETVLHGHSNLLLNTGEENGNAMDGCWDEG
jgi:hypothetical protein